MQSQEKIIRLLMVDDEEEFIAATGKILQRRGVEVITASDGITALNLMREFLPDIVILDLKMPGMDGSVVFDHIRDEFPGTPVIMLTGHGTVSNAFQMSKKGIYDYISKPCDMDELIGKIYKAVAASIEEKSKHSAGKKDNNFTNGESRIHVLIVDDETEFLDSMLSVLQRRNMQVYTAASAEEAFELLEDKYIQVIVLDIRMPGIDGLEALNILKKKYEEQQIILLTGHPTIETAMEGMKKGAFEFLMKPPDINELVDLIRKANEDRQEKLKEKQKQMIDNILKRYPD